MSTPQIETVAGTAVEQIERYVENPTDEPEHQKLFHDGWWQIVVTGDGKNPSFPARSWAFVLLAPIKRDESLKFDTDGIATIHVDPDATIKKVTTKIVVMDHDGINWEFPAIVIDIYSEQSGEDQFVYMCQEPVPIERPPPSRFN